MQKKIRKLLRVQITAKVDVQLIYHKSAVFVFAFTPKRGGTTRII